ncbi:MAG: hypothetical protein RKP46_13165 [Candidatus Accumulibacter sp.]|uniref:hypothetical protein n=1 Tax=Accumulibacter sp. TaxID=2053492 RepID=UPI00287829C8|nr:hypothetical protein [Accumulibacter sp.]MDS4015276.1 hypothetical protein [Accumulibacter sp.]
MKKIVIAVLLSAASGLAAAQSASSAPDSAAARLNASNAAQIDKDQLALRLESVGKLLDSSSASRQIEISGDPKALATREKAKGVYLKAKEAFGKGDLATANRLLPEATVLMFEAVRHAAPDDVVALKLQGDFNARSESVKALLGAYKRVAAEKGSKGVAETVASIEKSVAEADKLAAARKFAEGRAELDRAYLVAKAALSSLRGGDTLVRSLNFASKEEEYHYEVDRNDTHQMLIKVLVDEKRATNPQLDQQVQAFLDKARALRKEAEGAASRKDFAQAVKLLEESTAELVRAIRNAGVYIPS